MRLLGSPPNPNNVPPEYWNNGGAALREKVEPVLRQVYLQQAAAQIETVGIAIDWALVNQDAINWASQYTFELVSGITEGSRNTLQAAISNFFEKPMTRQQLEDSIAGAFDPVRAEMIAVTEVTRAAAEGEDVVVDRILRDNPSMERIDIWITKRDERVCKICGPLRERKADGYDGKTPYWIHPITGVKYKLPAHPRCRCGKRTDFKLRKKE
jgi:hypothetical protein